MKISCEVIKDLLPLYHDGVCSNESRKVVDEHLTECADCKTELQSMNVILPIANIGQNLNEAESIKKLSKRWRKGKIKSFLKGALIAIITIAVIVVIFSVFGTIRIISCI